MHITYKGDYALKAILDLAINYEQGPAAIPDLAGRLDIPIKFLEQILLDLKRGGFVESRRGKVGGYLLARHPRQIKLGEVIRFIDGPTEPIACLEKHYSGCKDIYKCAFRPLWQKVGRAVSAVVDNVTFEDLARQSPAGKQTLIYQI
jgi:Rrf2 family protein